MTAANPFDRLVAFDPDLARAFIAASRANRNALPEALLADVVAILLACFEQEIHLGEAVAGAYHPLLSEGTPETLALFGRQIRRAAARSAALGTHLARVLPPILLAGETGLWDAFRKTLVILLAKGDYLVKAPLAPLPALVAAEDEAAGAYLALLQAAFDRPLSYNRCQYLGNLLPRAASRFPASRRTPWLRQLGRLAAEDLDLIEPYLEGLDRELALLSPDALQRFVDRGLATARRDPQDGRRFLALRSGRGRMACQSLQTAATLEGQIGRLNRYIAARTGSPGRIRPLTQSQVRTAETAVAMPLSATDGRHVYLPEIVDCLPTQAGNIHLLGWMARFEAGLIEFGTFAFDLERGRDMGCLGPLAMRSEPPPEGAASDFTVFSRHFADPDLAMDLFTLYEHARVRQRLASTYPGLVAGGLPLYQDAMRSRPAGSGNSLDALYAVLALDMPLAEVPGNRSARHHLVGWAAEAFAAHDPETMRVEHCAGLVATTYDRFSAERSREGMPAARLSPPYRLPLDAALIEAAHRVHRREVDRLRMRLARCGLKLYRGDLRQLLESTAGRPTSRDILDLADRTVPYAPAEAPDPLQMLRHVEDARGPRDVRDDAEDPDDVDRITWLKEWNAAIDDYLHDHVRVRDRRLAGTDTRFFDDALERSAGLVRRIRRSFELLRPEGLGLLRPWVEGDDFDYRALLDFALDRKAGRLPSDRLYIKRVKQHRDVAVMLLVDLSRSTSNIVEGSTWSVLDVTKEALVLFTQALEVVGDAYALAGFSGTGRLGVDFFRIKDFEEPLSAGVKATLSGLTPQRSTRMGAAVRRAARELEGRDNQVRLLLMIGDGFPNDTEYKGDYAIQDTRRAIAEARSNGIITQAITVNLPTSPQLDDLYGPVRHTVISHVNELPDKLLRLYGTLTRA